LAEVNAQVLPAPLLLLASSSPPFVFARLMMRVQELLTRVEKKMDNGEKGY
jgi:hypothetical protein